MREDVKRRRGRRDAGDTGGARRRATRTPVSAEV